MWIQQGPILTKFSVENTQSAIQDLVQIWNQSNSIFMNGTRQLKVKTTKKQKKFEHKMASPAKRPKCRYDFVAFTWHYVDTYTFSAAMILNN